MAPDGSVCACSFCNNYGRRITDMSYFRFPKDKERCSVCVSFVQRKDLETKTSLELNRSLYIYVENILKEDFFNNKKNRLVWDAIPTLTVSRTPNTEPLVTVLI